MMTVDSGDSDVAAEFITNNHLKGKVGCAGWDVGTPVIDAVANGTMLLTIDQQAYLQGFLTDRAALPLQHLRRADEATEHRHRHGDRDQGPRRTV